MNYADKYLIQRGCLTSGKSMNEIRDFEKYLHSINAFADSKPTTAAAENDVVVDEENNHVDAVIKGLWGRIINQAAYGTTEDRYRNFRNCLIKLHKEWMDPDVLGSTFLEYCIKELGPKLKPKELHGTVPYTQAPLVAPVFAEPVMSHVQEQLLKMRREDRIEAEKNTASKSWIDPETLNNWREISDELDQMRERSKNKPTPEYMLFEKWLEERKKLNKINSDWDNAMMDQFIGLTESINLVGSIIDTEKKKDKKEPVIIEITLKIS
jgi:hypothetical protein